MKSEGESRVYCKTDHGYRSVRSADSGRPLSLSPPPCLRCWFHARGAGGASVGTGGATFCAPQVSCPSISVAKHQTGQRNPAGQLEETMKVCQRLASHLGKLEPPEVTGRACDLEDLLWHHPCLQGLQFAHGQIGGVMLDQKALEAVRKEVEVDRCRVARRVVPGTHTQPPMSSGWGPRRTGSQHSMLPPSLWQAPFYPVLTTGLCTICRSCSPCIPDPSHHRLPG